MKTKEIICWVAIYTIFSIEMALGIYSFSNYAKKQMEEEISEFVRTHPNTSSETETAESTLYPIMVK